MPIPNSGADYLLGELFSYEPIWEKAVTGAAAKGIRHNIVERYSSPSYRLKIKEAIASGKYVIRPPHEALIPKDDGTMRTVYANEAEDRILLTAVNDTLFRLCPGMIHPSCMSYKSGVGCGKVAKQASRILRSTAERGGLLGYKADLSKYFDSVPIEYIDAAFDEVEEKLGKSSVISLLRAYYHDDTVLDLRRRPYKKYTSLRQGCAVAAFLADVVLRDIDSETTSVTGSYWRYSDDILIVGDKAADAFKVVTKGLSRMRLDLNPKKISELDYNRWFTFLGFALKSDGMISLSKNRLRNLVTAIKDKTFKRCRKKESDTSRALSSLSRYLYIGAEDGYGAVEGLMSAVTSRHDIAKIDAFIMDCLRACVTGRTRVGGLGWNAHTPLGVITRGRGRSVRSNISDIPEVRGYVPMSHMSAVFRSSRAAYDTYARIMASGG